MRCVPMSEFLRVVSRFAVVGLVGGMAAACSGDSMRLSGNPFSNPFGEGKRSEPSMTGSIDQGSRSNRAIAPMPRSTISSAPLAAPGAARSSAAPSYTPASSPMASSGVSGLNPDARKRSAAPAPTSKLSQAAPVQSRPATRYQLVEGKKPVAGSSAAVARSVPAPKVPDSKAPGRTVSAATAKAAPVAQPAPQVAQAQKPVKAPEPIKAAAVVPAKPVQSEPARSAAPAKEPEATGALPSSTSSAEFRWPARGRVISGFGGSGSNEGINIAVPEGTPVKAAEAGTVAYAGSEVKGYGNLVLIRHENGFVSAYAHNGEIEVKRGQKVARGQVVAKSGQTGNVTSPQLHFEIRKGSTPVDPMPHLAGN